ncbi:MAG: hypothetical protein J7K71_01050 [Candidatus Omnitrophica bacterium]|nr:hypothetical protein [Candidatus Omnitrophota bacterium]
MFKELAVNLPKLRTHDIIMLILVMRNLLCCNEVCEFSAIKLNKSFLLRLIR